MSGFLVEIPEVSMFSPQQPVQETARSDLPTPKFTPKGILKREESVPAGSRNWLSPRQDDAVTSSSLAEVSSSTPVPFPSGLALLALLFKRVAMF